MRISLFIRKNSLFHERGIRLKAFEFTCAAVRRLERNKRPASRVLRRCATDLNSKVVQHTLHPARSHIDALFDFVKLRDLILLDPVERK